MNFVHYVNFVLLLLLIIMVGADDLWPPKYVNEILTNQRDLKTYLDGRINEAKLRADCN